MVLAITGVLALPLVAILGTANRVERTQGTRVDARAELDWALTLLTEDLRSGTPTDRPAVGPRMIDTLPLSVVDEFGTEELVHWRVATGGLERTTYDPATLRQRRRSVVVADISADGATAPFVYLDAVGSTLDPTALPAATVANCTTLVRITLAMPSGTDTEVASTDVAIRSRSPGGNGC